MKGSTRCSPPRNRDSSATKMLRNLRKVVVFAGFAEGEALLRTVAQVPRQNGSIFIYRKTGAVPT